jgi:succinoglycan biosynthesis transport protein ExoP
MSNTSLRPIEPTSPNRPADKVPSPKYKSIARQPEQGLPTMDLPFFWGIIRKGWIWILPVGLLLAGLSCAAVLALFKPTYEAKFRLEADPGNYVVFQKGGSDMGTFVELQKAIMLGNSVLEKALADEAVSSVPRIAAASDPVVMLRKELKVQSAAQGRIIDVKFADTDPNTAARVTNAVVDEYLRTRRTIEQLRTSTQEQAVQAVLQKAESEVEAAKQRVRDLSVSVVKNDTLVGESESGRIDTTYLDNMRMQRMELNSQIAILDLQFAEAKAAYEKALEAQSEGLKEQSAQSVITEEALDSDVVVVAARNQLTVAEKDLLDLKATTNVGEKNPIYIRVTRRIEMLQAELARIREARRKELAQRSSIVSRDSRREQLDQLSARLVELRTRKLTIESQVKEYLTSLKQSSAGSVDLQFAEADLEEWSGIRTVVHQRRIQLQTEREAQDTVKQLERAIAPRTPVESLPVKQLGIAGAVGLGVPFLLAVLLELRSRRVNDASQLEARSHLSVLGEISMIPVQSSNGRSSKRTKSRELRLFEESVDSLSTTLILREDLRDARVFTITSALSGEGKTSVSSQLAVSIARATGKRVLLVDGDMRAPDIHHVFGRQMNGGLIAYLNGEADWRELVDKDWSDSVHILSAGVLKGSPHRLLSGNRLQELIREAREEYDFIVMDTPPVLPASETLLFAQAADVCLMCALRDKSRIEQLIQAYHRLEASGARVAGSVLSGVPVREYASYYGDYYASKFGSSKV